jgi:hypothetical protein
MTRHLKQATVMAFASLVATDGSAIFAPSAACGLCNFGTADRDCFGCREQTLSIFCVGGPIST